MEEEQDDKVCNAISSRFKTLSSLFRQWDDDFLFDEPIDRISLQDGGQALKNRIVAHVEESKPPIQATNSTNPLSSIETVMSDVVFVPFLKICFN